MAPSENLDTEPPFRGTSRFEILGRLGRGGMGVVYRARDRERDVEVALKTLRKLDAASLFRFKKEFRALTDIVHDNLVSLYELVYDDDCWFFTMEIVTGVDFVTWVHGQENRPPLQRFERAETVAEDTSATRSVVTGSEREVELPTVDYVRLRSSLEQLARGIHALHTAGYLHRDVKPSNVLVTPAGRVVLLDFGVITEVAGARWQTGDAVEAVGTPSYMAPEQATERGADEASDWYSLGVLLYEALTGRRPFEGARADVLRAKQSTVPAPPRLIAPGVPADLDELCMELLAAEPASRPLPAEILRRLGVRKSRAPTVDPGGVAPELAGRAGQLAALTAAFEATQRGEGLIALVHGISGMGKSTLVERFLDTTVARTNAVVLAGRCYERESVPYKAVDSLVDALCHYLLGLSPRDAEALMPRDAQSLATVFPVLRRVETIAQAPRRARAAPDPREFRRRAFGALRELLSRLADRHPLILCVDDLQWGDADSASLIEVLMRRPDAPALLFLGAYRSDEVEQSPLLRGLLDGARGPGAPRLEQVAVEMLSEHDAEALATRLLGPAADPAIAATVARESGGNPFFVHELARFHRTRARNHTATTGGVTLKEVILERVDALPEAGQRFIIAASVAGKPTEQQVILRAGDVDAATRDAVLSSLRAASLIRTSGVHDLDLVEPYHDRVRETVVESLSPEALARVHRALAVAIQELEHPDAETLAAHFHAAGERASAADYALRAAAKADAALSFGRAAELYRLALELGELEPGRRRELLARRALALVNAGRGPDAAAAFVEAAALSEGFEATELRRQAAEHWLRSGHVDEGMTALRSVLDDVGLSLPATSASAIASLLLARARLLLRGLRFRRRDLAELRGLDVARIDVSWSIATGLSLVAPIRSAVYGPRGVSLSLAAGDPYRIARSLALEAGFLSALGTRTEKRAEKLLARAQVAADMSRHPHAHALVMGMRAFCAYERGRFGDAHAGCEAALELLRDTCSGTYWESGALQLFSMHSLISRGELAAARRLVGERLSDAEERGDLHTATSVRLIITPTLYLVDDDVEGAAREVDFALGRWCDSVSDEFSQQHYMALSMQVQFRLYAGDGRGALAVMEENEPDLRKSLLMNVQLIRANWRMQEANACLLAAAEGAADATALLARAVRTARKLERERTAWCSAVAVMIRAGAAARSGNPEQALALTRAGIEALEACGLHANLAAAQQRLAALVGGTEGQQLSARADAWCRGERVVNPAVVLDLFAPGF